MDLHFHCLTQCSAASCRQTEMIEWEFLLSLEFLVDVSLSLCQVLCASGCMNGFERSLLFRCGDQLKIIPPHYGEDIT